MSDAERCDSSEIADCVELFENMGEWFVRVVIDGEEQVSTFAVEAYARSFADGQRIRLGRARRASPPGSEP